VGHASATAQEISESWLHSTSDFRKTTRQLLFSPALLTQRQPQIAPEGPTQVRPTTHPRNDAIEAVQHCGAEIASHILDLDLHTTMGRLDAREESVARDLYVSSWAVMGEDIALAISRQCCGFGARLQESNG